VSDYQALIRAGYSPFAAAQIVRDAKNGDIIARVAIAEARGKL
jgi:hypothetical protein